MKLQEIEDMMDIKKYQQVWSIFVLIRKQNQELEYVNEQLAEALHKTVIKKFKRRKVYVKFEDNFWAADLAEIESLLSKNENVQYLLSITDTFIKYAWVKPLKDKKHKSVLNAFIRIVNESNRTPNKLWAEQEDSFTINL